MEWTKNNPDGSKASQTQLNVPVWDAATGENVATNLTTSYSYNSAGELVETTDPRGLVTQSTYNAAGQVTATFTGNNPPVTEQFDSQGNLRNRGQSPISGSGNR
jgi:YD repeat-containing protein